MHKYPLNTDDYTTLYDFSICSLASRLVIETSKLSQHSTGAKEIIRVVFADINGTLRNLSLYHPLYHQFHLLTLNRCDFLGRSLEVVERSTLDNSFARWAEFVLYWGLFL